MTFDYGQLDALRRDNVEVSYTDRETLHYALSIGMGRDATDANELPYVCELIGDKTVPTMASVLGPNAMTLSVEGIQSTGGVHGEQYLTLHRPLPATGELLIDNRVLDVFDKGTGKAALVYGETSARLKDTDEPLFTERHILFRSGGGGFGGHTEGAPVAHKLPDRKPDASCESSTTHNQALIYALNGDRVPLHRDPSYTASRGYERPIMHGLCTYGIACQAVLKTMCDYDHTAICGFDVRFSAILYPGETIITDMWRDGNIISFRSRLKERDAVVLNNGKCTLTTDWA